MATVYAITSWIIVEVADTVFPYLGLPDWLVTAIIIFLLIGFPIALILSWIFEMGQEGIIKTPSVEEEENPLPSSKRKPFTSTLTIVVLAVLLVVQFVYFGFIRKSNPGALLDEVRIEKVGVAAFNNFTGDENLDAFGLMASEWITSGLRELKVQTSSPEMMRKNRDNVGILPGNPDKKISLFELTGAKYVVTGSYYTSGDQIQVSSRLESTETGDVIYDFPILSGHMDEKELLIGEIREKMKGYWAVKEADDLAHISPPKYEAYQVLMDCEGDPSDFYCHLNAISVDSSFMLARVYIYHSSMLWEQDSVHDEAGRYIREHWKECTEFEKNYFTFVENVKKKMYEAAASALDENLRLDPRDITSIHESAHFWLGVNRPDKAVERYKTLFDQFEVFRERLNGNMYRNYFDALNRMGREKDVTDLMEKFEAEDLHRMGYAGRTQLVRALLSQGDPGAEEEILKLFTQAGIETDHLGFAYVYNDLFPDAPVNIFAEALRQNLDAFTDPEASGSYVISASGYLHNYRSRAFALYVLQEYEQAERIFRDLKQIDWDSYLGRSGYNSYQWYMRVWVEGLLGAVYARQGKVKQAKEQLEELEALHPHDPLAMNRMFQGEVPYYQARIHAILGEEELAVQVLKLSMEEGRISEHGTFVQDWDLAVLRNYPPYLELVGLK